MHNLTSKNFWLVKFAILIVTSSLVLTAHDMSTNDTCQGLTRGKDFVIGFTDCSGRPIILVVTFTDQDTEVSISSKHKVEGQPLQQTVTIRGLGSHSIEIPREYRMYGTERSYKGVKITASYDISVYGVCVGFGGSFLVSPYGFLAIPINNIGDHYVLVTPREQKDGGGFSLPALFAVVGIEDSTSVQVTLRSTEPVTFEGETYYSGDVISFMVNNLEAVQIYGRYFADFTGTIIQTDKPVSAFTARLTSTVGSGGGDVSEQLIPVTSWGLRHIYTAFDSADSNYYSVVASFNNTVVTIPGVGDHVLNTGDVWEGRLTGSGLVSSSNTTSMMQLLATIDGSVVDPALIQIPSERHFGYYFGFATPPRSNTDGFYNFVNIVVKNESQNTVHLNNVPITDLTPRLSEIPDTNYVVATIEVPKEEQSLVYYIEQTDPNASPLSVIVYGYESYGAYGYSGGLLLPSTSSSNQTLTFSPSYFREIGGENILITVPCISNTLISRNAICKFETGLGEVLVLGERVSSYIVQCVTPTFYRIGLTQLQVSLDDGHTYPYAGNIYVASQEEYPPLANAGQSNWDDRAEYVIDLQVDDEVILSWDSASLGDSVSHVDVLVQNFDMNSDGLPVLGAEETTLLINIENSGNVVIPTEVVRSHFEDRNGEGTNAVTPLATFSLRPSAHRDRNSPISIIAVASAGVSIALYYGIECDSYDSILLDEPKDVPPCPCNFAQANSDFNFILSNAWLDLYHPGAVNCFRSSSRTSESGQQCCYDKDGNIIVGPPGGGTEDTYSPDGLTDTSRHFLYDVVPWFACCYFSDQCDKYYLYRKSDDCSEYNPPRPAKCVGDPHMTTLDGKEFTFNGAGEFLMIDSTLHDLTVQSRMEVYSNTEASIYTAVVVQIEDSAKVQVERLRTSQTSILVDGEPLYLGSSPIRVHNFNGVQISVSTEDSSDVRVAFKSGVVVIFHMVDDVMSFIAEMNEEFQGQISGLLGNLNGDPEDDFQFPNGTIIRDLSSLKDIHDYALTWMIAEEDSIFTYVSPYDYNTYHFPDFTPIFDLHNADNLSQEIIDVCGDSFECTFDAVTTGSLSFANMTLEVSATFDSIQNSSVKIVSCGFPGTVQNGQVEGHVYLVDSIVTVTCDEGFKLDGSSTLICNADGNWSSNLPQCVPSNTSDNSSVILGVTLGIVAFVIVVVVIILVVFKLKKN